MTSNAKSIHENQILTYQMQGCGNKMATISHGIFRICQLIQYKFILQYSTDVDAKCFT